MPTDSAPKRRPIPHPTAEQFHAGREEEKEEERKSGQVIHEPHLPRATSQPVDHPHAGAATDMDEPLFAGFETPSAPELGEDARRALRQQATIAQGWHPLGGKLHPDADRDRTPASGKRDPLTCGTCQLRGLVGGHAKSFPKCHRRGAPVTNGPATDVRAWWPACTSYQPKGGA